MQGLQGGAFRVPGRPRWPRTRPAVTSCLNEAVHARTISLVNLAGVVAKPPLSQQGLRTHVRTYVRILHACVRACARFRVRIQPIPHLLQEGIFHTSNYVASSTYVRTYAQRRSSTNSSCGVPAPRTNALYITLEKRATSSILCPLPGKVHDISHIPCPVVPILSRTLREINVCKTGRRADP